MNPFRSILSPVRTFNRPARLFLLATISDGIVFSAWMLFFNFYILQRGFGRDFLGLANAMPSISALLLSIPIGMLSDRIGRRRSMLIGLGLGMTCMALEITLLDPTLILVMAFLSGVGNMLFYLSQAPFMMKVSGPDNRALLFSLNFGLVTLAGSVGNLFAGQLPALFGSWLQVPARSAAAYQAVLLTSVGMSLFTLFPILLIHEPPAGASPPVEGRASQSGWRIAFRAIVLKLTLPNLLLGFGAAILIPYMNVFFADRFQIRDQTLGLLFSLSALLTGVGSVIGPQMAHRLGGKIRSVVATQSSSLAFLLLIGFSPTLWLSGIGFLMRAVLMNMAVPLYHAFAMEQIQEREQGTVNSVIETGWQLGWAAGTYLSGLVQQAYGFTPLFIITAIMYGGSILFTWVYFREHEPKAAAEVLLDVE